MIYTFWLVLLSATNGDKLAEARILSHPMTPGECIAQILARGPKNTIDGKVVLYECRKETGT